MLQPALHLPTTHAPAVLESLGSPLTVARAERDVDPGERARGIRCGEMDDLGVDAVV